MGRQYPCQNARVDRRRCLSGEALFREIDRLHDGDMVVVCEKLSPWLGVVYSSALLGYQTTILTPVEQSYTGPCEHGWVLARYISLSKNQN